jgi:hypothetical protein
LFKQFHSASLEDALENTDAEINEIVFRIYGLTEEEKDTVKNNL